LMMYVDDDVDDLEVPAHTETLSFPGGPQTETNGDKRRQTSRNP
jgi:hypothetical protein